jgi:hypothetical protein
MLAWNAAVLDSKRLSNCSRINSAGAADSPA